MEFVGLRRSFLSSVFICGPLFRRSLSGAAAVLLLVTGCGDDGEPSRATPTATVTGAPSPTPTGTPPGAGGESKCPLRPGSAVNFDAADPACELLSSYRFFVGEGRLQVPNEGVVPYDLNTELFADYTRKHRFVRLPPGSAAQYSPEASFDFPVGTVFIKTFAAPLDLRTPAAGERVLETRLLIRRASGWVGLPYVWNEEQTEARLRAVGAVLDVTGVQADGVRRTHEYDVPNVNQCKACHREHDDVMGPLGPKARNLNKPYAYADDVENQLARWGRLGILHNAPDPATAPRAPRFDDADDGSIELRARTYLDVNCSHCHNRTGRARPTDLYLDIAQDNPFHLGICKGPTAAGVASGTFRHIIDPGRPETSILVRRLNSDDPDIRMPELGRRRVHAEAVRVVSEWIATLEPGCE